MAKFRLAGRRAKKTGAPNAGLPCVILVLAGLALLGFFMLWVLKSNAPG
jgi:hypothetical protein